MKKAVLKVSLHDDRAKQKAMKMASSISGIESISMDMKEEKLTVIGEVDPVQVVSKLRKFWHAEILTLGPAKEPEKTKKEDDDKGKKKKEEEDNKGKKKKEEEDNKKKEEETKKKKEEEDNKKKEEETKKKKKEEEGDKKKDQSDQVSELVRTYPDGYNRPYMNTYYYYVPSAEENPNACVIC